jgi:hypothetical protein
MIYWNDYDVALAELLDRADRVIDRSALAQQEAIDASRRLRAALDERDAKNGRATAPSVKRV